MQIKLTNLYSETISFAIIPLLQAINQSGIDVIIDMPIVDRVVKPDGYVNLYRNGNQEMIIEVRSIKSRTSSLFYADWQSDMEDMGGRHYNIDNVLPNWVESYLHESYGCDDTVEIQVRIK